MRGDRAYLEHILGAIDKIHSGGERLHTPLSGKSLVDALRARKGL